MGLGTISWESMDPRLPNAWELLTAFDRALDARLLFREKPKSSCVNFLWETIGVLKLGGCRLGV